MKFQKGSPKPAGSGRKKGTPNKKYFPGVEEFLASRGVNPIEEILKLIPTLPVDEKLSAWKTLASYTFAKPSGDDGLPPLDPSVPAVADLLSYLADLTPAQLQQVVHDANPAKKNSSGSGLQ